MSPQSVKRTAESVRTPSGSEADQRLKLILRSGRYPDASGFCNALPYTRAIAPFHEHGAKSKLETSRSLRGFFIKLLLQPLIHQRLDFNAALGRLFFYLVQQFELNGNGANHFEFGVRCVGIELVEV